MSNFRYVDSTKLVVVRDLETGGCESHSVDANEVTAYLAADGVIDDPLPPTLAQQQADIDGQLASLDAILPRAVEDMWVLCKVDMTQVAPSQLAVQQQKIALRAQRKALS